jgi:hypothetical protein
MSLSIDAWSIRVTTYIWGEIGTGDDDGDIWFADR